MTFNTYSNAILYFQEVHCAAGTLLKQVLIILLWKEACE